MFEDKYNLTRQQSVFLAKKKWDENIFCGMKMENRNVTFPETQTILNGVNVPGVSLDDITAILNMRDAWRYLLKDVDEVLDLTFICKINEFVSRNESLEWGVLRTGNVGISSVAYKPSIPEKEKVEQELQAILSSNESDTGKALSLFTWGARGQLFWDGNKRTSLMISNKMLLSTGRGMLIIKDKDMLSFFSLLSDFYESGDDFSLKDFLHRNCLFGIDL